MKNSFEFKNIKAIHSKENLFNMIEEGEHVQQDFKYAISDSRKIARSISAFANNRGGRLLIGVKDNGNLAGVKSEEEFYMIEQAAELYCIPPQKVENTVYTYSGKCVLVASVSPSDKLVAVKEEGGKKRAYYRVADENILIPKEIEYILQQADKCKQPNFSQTEANVLDYIENNADVDIKAIAISLKMSTHSVSLAVMQLYKMDLVKFDYKNKWHLLSREASDAI